MQCPRCEGSGQCSECLGQGFVPCVSCSGSGQRSSSRGGSYPCRGCQGTGKSECSPSCASCEGTGQITSQLQDKVRGKYEVRFDNTHPLGTVTHSIVALVTVVYVAGLLSPHLQDQMEQNFVNYSGMWTQPWRLVTSAFLHAGFVHLFCNALVLSRYGPAVEGVYGSRRFALLYLLSALGGSVVSSAMHQLLGEPVASLGASGAVFGVFGAVCGLYWRYRAVPYEQVRDLFLWQAVTTCVAIWMTGTIDHWCHLGGFLAGFAYASLTRRPSGR